MRRLVCACVVRKLTKTGFLALWPIFICSNWSKRIFRIKFENSRLSYMYIHWAWSRNVLESARALKDLTQIICILKGSTNCSPLVADACFDEKALCCLSLTILKLMLLRSMYLDDLPNICKSYFKQIVIQIYPTQANRISVKHSQWLWNWSPFHRFYLSISNGI